MAEPALAVASAAPTAQDIKQEHGASGLDGLHFNLPPDLASKRPFNGDDGDVSEAKRAKTDDPADETSLEDGLALLVQNALSNVDDFVGQFGGGPDVAPMEPSSEAMDVDPAPSIPEAPAARASFVSEPQNFIREASVHALGNLALSLLLALAQPPLEETMKLRKPDESEQGHSYRQLKSAFETVRGIYSTNPVLTSDHIDTREPDSKTILELANLAQLGSWLVDGTPKSLSDADDYFLSMFQCTIADLPAGMSDLYIAIKTQRAIEFLVDKEPEKPAADIIGEVLIEGLEEALKGQHDDGELTTADQSFVSTMQTRKETLQGEAKEQEEPAALRDSHPAEELLRTYLLYVRERLDTVSELARKMGVHIKLDEAPLEVQTVTVTEPEHETTGNEDLDLEDLSSFFEKTASGLVQNALAGLTEEEAAESIEGADGAAQAGHSKPDGSKIDLSTDYKELEALVAESTQRYVKTTLNGLSPMPYQPTVPTSTAESMEAQMPYLTQLQQHQAQNPYYTYTQPPAEAQPQPPPPASAQNLPPNQTCPSSVLYDKARQAALSKTTSHTRRDGPHSTRRPWTQEEEKALMAGLDMVKGPHWSQILTLFGVHGTMSDILKDRTQVQLKDKARNLKLFFLKTSSEMPYYLQAVTGELKTRAPTQAARKEAEERARVSSEEDQAKLQGIMALAGGLQHPQNRTSASPVNGGATGVQAGGHYQAVQQRLNAAHQPSVSSIPRQLATAASQQMRHGIQDAHSVPPAPPRPQGQLPPQVPRPQGQPQPLQQLPQQGQAQHNVQNGQQDKPQQQAQQPRPNATPSPSAPTSSIGQGPQQAQNQQGQVAQSAVKTEQTAAPAPAPAQTQAQPAATSAPTAASPATTAAPAQATPAEAPTAPKVEAHDDDAAEAALLEGLQAVVAQSLGA